MGQGSQQKLMIHKPDKHLWTVLLLFTCLNWCRVAAAEGRTACPPPPAHSPAGWRSLAAHLDGVVGGIVTRVDPIDPSGQHVSALNGPFLIWGRPGGSLALLLWVEPVTQWVNPAHSHLEQKPPPTHKNTRGMNRKLQNHGMELWI